MATGSALSNPPDGPDGLPQVLDLFPRGPEGDAAGGSVRPPGVEEGEDSQDTGGPGGPPKPPKAGTKPWRKSWKNRWREGSTFRELNTLERNLVFYIEDNADDDGKILTTSRWLAKMMTPTGRGHKKVSHVTVWRALQRMQELGLIRCDVDEKVKQNLQHGPTTVTRLNYRKYQDPKIEDETHVVRNVKRSSRYTDPVAKATDAPAARKRPPDPIFDALLDALRQQYLAIVGEPIDIQPHHLGDLKASRKVIGDDAEVVRRWREFLKDQFYPTKNLNRFRVAHAKYAKPKAKPMTLRPIPGIDTDE